MMEASQSFAEEKGGIPHVYHKSHVRIMTDTDLADTIFDKAPFKHNAIMGIDIEVTDLNKLRNLLDQNQVTSKTPSENKTLIYLQDYHSLIRFHAKKPDVMSSDLHAPTDRPYHRFFFIVTGRSDTFH